MASFGATVPSSELAEPPQGVLYGSLIDLYETYAGDNSAVFLEEFKRRWPHIYVGRADRFMRTVQRIVSPCLPSILGKVTLRDDAAKEIYRLKTWIPRIRNLVSIRALNVTCMMSSYYFVDHSSHINEPLDCGITNTEEHDYTPSFMDSQTINSEDTTPPATPAVECGNVDGYDQGDVPMFIDPHYLPRNVRKREKRKEDRVQTLKKQILGLKQEVKNKENFINELERKFTSTVDQIKRQKRLKLIGFKRSMT